MLIYPGELREAKRVVSEEYPAMQRRTQTDLAGGAVHPGDEGAQLRAILAPVANTVEAPGVFDVGPPVHRPEQVVVVVVVGGHNLTTLRYLAGGLADVGEVVSGDDFNIGNTAVRDEAGPGIETDQVQTLLSAVVDHKGIY